MNILLLMRWSYSYCILPYLFINKKEMQLILKKRIYFDIKGVTSERLNV